MPQDFAVETILNSIEIPEGEVRNFNIDDLSQIVQKVVDMIKQYCPKKNVVNNANDPNFLQRHVLRRYIKDACPDRDSFKKYGTTVERAVLKAGKNATTDQVARLFDPNS